jgi:Haem-degrading
MKNSAKGVPAVALKVLMAVGIAVLLCGRANAQGAGNAQGPANAQGLVTQRNLSLAMAKTVAEAALAACQAKGYHTAVAVVDRAGQVMVILRDEQATAQGVHGADVSHHHYRVSEAHCRTGLRRATGPPRYPGAGRWRSDSGRQ